MCDKPSTSREHVPPKSFFPEDPNLRKQLITVHSCKEHNLSNSMDDEYVRALIAFHFQNNQAAYDLSMTKIKSSLEQSKGFWELFFGEEKNQFVNLGGTQFASVAIDSARFNSEMQKIARGIYFNHFDQKSRETVLIYSPSLLALNVPSIDLIDLAKMNAQAQPLWSMATKYGANPDIFYYQIAQNTETIQVTRPYGLIVPIVQTFTVMRMLFYTGFEVIAVFDEQAQG